MQSPRSATIEGKMARLHELISTARAEDIKEFKEKLDISWIYHDSSLEGLVYNYPELKAAIDNQVVSDSSLIPVYDEIRQHKRAIDLTRELAEKKRLVLNMDIVKSLYTILATEEEAGGGMKYRKDIPVHRVYFHDISPPDKIQYRLKQLFEWLNDDETKKTTHPMRLAAKMHFQWMQVFPFTKESGKIGRLFMNLILMRSGYPPAIIHSTERQRYYEALKVGSNALTTLVHESLLSALESGIRYFQSQQVDEHGRRARSA